jgi:hypothetical protein
LLIRYKKYDVHISSCYLFDIVLRRLSGSRCRVPGSKVKYDDSS